MGFCCNGFGWGNWGDMGGLGTIGLTLNLVFVVGALALLVVAAIWLARRLGRQPRASAVEESPLEAARRRLAAGEITVGEFDEIWDRRRRGTALADR